LGKEAQFGVRWPALSCQVSSSEGEGPPWTKKFVYWVRLKLPLRVHRLFSVRRCETRTARAAKRTPSDHDWRWAQDRIRSGESISVLIQRLEDYRYDKPRPQYYARRTVTRAYAKVALSRGDNPEAVVQAIQAYPPNSYENGEQYARQTVQEFMAKLGMANEQQQGAPAHRQEQAQQLGLGVTP
jgi:hypothetical protein